MVAEIFDWIEMALTYAAISDYSTHADIHFNLPAYPVRKVKYLAESIPGLNSANKAQ